jgi:hypothetical protein
MPLRYRSNILAGNLVAFDQRHDATGDFPAPEIVPWLVRGTSRLHETRVKPSAIQTAGAVVLLLLIAMLGGCASVGERRREGSYLAWQQKLKTSLSSSVQTEHLDIFYRPGSKSAAHAKRIGTAAEEELAQICRRLEVPNDVRYTLFLFEDHEDLAKTTELPGTGGFSWGKTSCLLYGDRPARIHEMVHIVAAEKIVGGQKNMFRVEGLANAVLDSFGGWDVHAVAKHYRDTGQMPPLREMTETTDFYGWLQKHSHLNTYDIAGSWMKFLLETQGVEKTKRYYGPESVREAFGVPLEDLEKDWLAALERYQPTEEIALQVGASNGRSPDRFTVVEGESFSGRIEFHLAQAPQFNADGTVVLAYGGQFTTRPLTSPEPEVPTIKYGWLKNGVQLENAKSPSLALSNITSADAGTYVGLVAYKDGDTEPRVIAAWVVMLTVIPRTELSLP